MTKDGVKYGGRQVERQAFMQFLRGYNIPLREIRPMVFAGEVMCANGGMAILYCIFGKEKDIVEIYDMQTKRLIHQVANISREGRTKDKLDKLTGRLRR